MSLEMSVWRSQFLIHCIFIFLELNWKLSSDPAKHCNKFAECGELLPCFLIWHLYLSSAAKSLLIVCSSFIRKCECWHSQTVTPRLSERPLARSQGIQERKETVEGHGGVTTDITRSFWEIFGSSQTGPLPVFSHVDRKTKQRSVCREIRPS